MPKYFDIHSHLNLPGYEADFDEVIVRLKETGTHTIVVGVDYESSRKAVELAEKHEEIYACVGQHPVDRADEQFDAKKYEALVAHPKVVAVGECGLDFFHASKAEDLERQKKLFVEQIEFAIKHKKPLMIHARNAYAEILDILEGYRGLARGNVHFFAGTLEEAQGFFDLGFSVSFTGVITFASQYDEVIKKAPLEKIMAETDAPFVAPAPHRGKRNEPSYVREVYRRVAEIRGEDAELVRETLVNNALRMIG